ncbi:MAG: ATP-binding protein [Candidatus Korarchaeota archaeon]|nr:ATP-binding protein [Candidatus Korarchaeota archaeon]
MSMLEWQNPWWEGKKSKVVLKWEERKYKWVPSWLNEISLEPFSLNFVVGPRQVGKTTGLHLLIDRLIKGGVEPQRIFFLDLDLIWDLDSFKRALDDYLRMRAYEGHDSSYIILDEVSSLEGWWRLVKGYIDLGIFDNDVLILTGSSSLRVRGNAELFPGRMGKGVEVEALPLSFREFLQVKGIEVKRTGNLEKDMVSLLPVRERVRGLFRDYMRLGGYPLSVNEDPAAEESFIRSVIGELLRLGRNPSLASAVVGSLFKKAPSPLSYSSIGSDVGVSYKTVRDYLEVLKGLMVVGEAPFMESGSVKWRKERKYFIRDPFLVRSLAGWVGVDPLPSAVYEWVVQEHLLRRFGRVYYWRDGYEVDAVAGGLRVEVKAGKPHRRYPRDVLILDEYNIADFLAVII